MKRVLVAIGLVLFAASVVLPLAWVLMTSLKTSQEIFRSPWGLPSSLQWGNFAKAWQEAGIAKYTLNSLLVCVATLVILLPVGSMAAYVLARYPFRFSKLIFGTFVGGMMFPQFLAIIPLFFLISSLGLLDTLHGLVIVYVAFSLPFTVFVMSGFFQSLPRELEEAAIIDGANHYSVFWKVMMPLAKPGLVVVGIFNAIGLWNEYPLALVLIPSDDKRTLPLGVANLVMVEHYQSDWATLFAALVIVMVPVLVVYWIFREKINQTMLAGALKG